MLRIYISRFLAGLVNYKVYNLGTVQVLGKGTEGWHESGITYTEYQIILPLEGTKPKSLDSGKDKRGNANTVPKDRDK